MATRTSEQHTPPLNKLCKRVVWSLAPHLQAKYAIVFDKLSAREHNMTSMKKRTKKGGERLDESIAKQTRAQKHEPKTKQNRNKCGVQSPSHCFFATVGEVCTVNHFFLSVDTL
jgi:hypothetical protein